MLIDRAAIKEDGVTKKNRKKENKEKWREELKHH
jgi:hypothetical protein